MKKNFFHAIIIGLLVAVSFASCAEQEYYHKNHYHTERYYNHHPHRHPPPGVDIHIHN
jgi:hypothetical protein